MKKITIKLQGNGFSQHLEENEINMYFFDWISNYCKGNNLNYLFNREKGLSPIEKRSAPWKTLNNKIVEFEYPPLEGIKIQIKELKIEPAPFKDVDVEDKVVDKRDIKKLHQQLNYSNTVLETMSKQLTRIENKII